MRKNEFRKLLTDAITRTDAFLGYVKDEAAQIQTPMQQYGRQRELGMRLEAHVTLSKLGKAPDKGCQDGNAQDFVDVTGVFMGEELLLPVGKARHNVVCAMMVTLFDCWLAR